MKKLASFFLTLSILASLHGRGICATEDLAPRAPIAPRAAAALGRVPTMPSRVVPLPHAPFESLQAEAEAQELSPATPAVYAPRAWLRRLGVLASSLRFWDGAEERDSAANPGWGGSFTNDPLEPIVINGVEIQADPAPEPPRRPGAPSVVVNGFGMGPDGQPRRGSLFGAGPQVLDANPASAADVERALRQLVDMHPDFGLRSEDLKTVHVSLDKGLSGRADTYYALFHQQKKIQNPGAAVEFAEVRGASLSFTVKVLNGKPQVWATMDHLVGDLQVNTRKSLSDDDLKARAEQRLGLPPNSGIELQFLERRIISAAGAWHAVNLYAIEGFPVLIAVDIADGRAFLWDERTSLTASKLTGEASGRGSNKNGPKDNDQIVPMALPYLDLTLSDGRRIQTDKEGRFDFDWDSDQPVTVKATLSGKYVNVVDHKNRRQPLEVSVTITPGQDKKARLVFNPEGENEEVVALVNGYVVVNDMRDFYHAHGIDDARIDEVLTVTVNYNGRCNAYYTRKTVTTFAASVECENTAQKSVLRHEDGHNVDDRLGGIHSREISEANGDIASILRSGNPVLGEGFFRKVPPGRQGNWVRNEGLDNDKQYEPGSEEHAGGEILGAAVYKVKFALEKLVDMTYQVSLLLKPSLLSKPRDVPAAGAQILLADMDKNGNFPHEDAIRAAFRKHGIDLPKRPNPETSLWALLTAPFAVTPHERYYPHKTQFAEGQDFSFSHGLLKQGDPAIGYVQKSFRVAASAGAAIREELDRFAQRHPDVKMNVQYHAGWRAADFMVTATGPKAKIEFLRRTIKRLTAR